MAAMFGRVLRDGAASKRKPLRRSGLISGVVTCLAAAILCRWIETPLGLLLAVPTAFVGFGPLSSTARDCGTSRIQRNGKGFGSPGGSGPSSAQRVEVEAPKEGWPTVSVILVGADRKFANKVALQELAGQDYPQDKIREVVVGGAAEYMSDAPEGLKGQLRDFESKPDEPLNLHKELSMCSGDIVVVWGDDHVSPSHRLGTQVLAALTSKASVLQPNWFFDPVDRNFQMVKQYPTAQFKEFLEASGQKVTEGYAELVIQADPLTLCARREALVEASEKSKAKADDNMSPKEELKEIITLLESQSVQIIDDLSWTVVGEPPAATQIESAKPDKVLQQLAESAWPQGKGANMPSLLDGAVNEIKQASMSPAQAIERLLAENVKSPVRASEAKRIRQLITQILAKSSGKETISAIEELTSWDGIAIGRGSEQMALNFPIFWAAFVAMRKHVENSADFWTMDELAKGAFGMTKLAKKMWAADPDVMQVMERILQKELYRTTEDELETDRGLQTSDIAGTLGIRRGLEAIAYAAVDQPKSIRPPVDSLSLLALALGEAHIENRGLQLKLAQWVMTDIDKLAPPDIGNLFLAMHEHQWFKDQNTVAYLTEAMRLQIQTLKKNDAGLREIIQANVEEQTSASSPEPAPAS
mmetsp:Transcript_146646/g.372177  ORF Transcript_146646/g.372177 Transcript_146646/m.372177 type:complete len:644 (-) Transcript_146646:63-1994(-)